MLQFELTIPEINATMSAAELRVSAVWGGITGDIEDQDDLQEALEAKQPKLPTVTNNRYLHTNASTGALEWSEVNSAVWGGITGDIEDQDDLQEALGDKVDKVTGKGLSTNDYTTAEKNKLAGVEANADVTDAANVAAAGATMGVKVNSVELTKDADGKVNIPLAGQNEVGAVRANNYYALAMDAEYLKAQVLNANEYSAKTTAAFVSKGTLDNLKVTSFQATPDDTHYPTEKLVKDSLDGKVDKEDGKGLSTNDYTTAEKNKLSGIEANADVTDAANVAAAGAEMTANRRSSFQATPDDTHYPTEKLVKDSLDGKANVSHTHQPADLQNVWAETPRQIVSTTSEGVMSNMQFLAAPIPALIPGEKYRIAVTLDSYTGEYIKTAFYANGTYHPHQGSAGTFDVTLNNAICLGDDEWLKGNNDGTYMGFIVVSDPDETLAQQGWTAGFHALSTAGATITITALNYVFDTKHIPDKTYSETWTFTLSDNTTVTKDVALWQ